MPGVRVILVDVVRFQQVAVPVIVQVPEPSFKARVFELVLEKTATVMLSVPTLASNVPLLSVSVVPAPKSQLS